MEKDLRKTVICFGDSNTFGYKPDGSGRFGRRERWPGRLQALLGDGYRVAEEGACGRTILFREEGNLDICGLDCIRGALERNRPADLLIVMLGTNDCKTEYGASPLELAAGLERLAERAAGILGAPEKVLLIAPAPLGASVEESVWGYAFDRDSIRKSLALAEEYKKIAARGNYRYLDASRVIQASAADCVHLDQEAHGALAKAVAELING